MIVDKLKMVLSEYKTNTNKFFIRSVLKESLQDYILNFVYNDREYKKLIFTGGTCLRKVYGLARLSEDLDFDFLDLPARSSIFSIENFAKSMTMYFARELQYKDITTKISGNKQTVFLKFPILDKLGLVKNSSDSTLLFVRCDFWAETIGVYTTQVNSISAAEFTLFALSYDLPTLFANKIMAFLERDFFKGGKQEIPFKGRDLFDLVWFLEKSKKSAWNFKPNWKRLFVGLKIEDPYKIASLIVEKVERIDKSDVYTDLLPFIESAQTLENFSDNFALLIKDHIKSVI